MITLGPISPETHSAADVVAALGLEPLDQEGGFFRRTAEAESRVRVDPDEVGVRAYSTIYALFTPEMFSAMHVLTTDEIWCWHAGDSLASLRLKLDGSGEMVRLGLDVAAGERPQDVIPAGVWQGTRLVSGGRWALVTCVMAPEFRWEDFTLGDRGPLTDQFPDWADEIGSLTRDLPPEGMK